MIAFEPQRGSRVSCQTDFTYHGAANVHFYDAGFTHVPFHVSLRPNEGRVVVNQLTAKGWGREIFFDHQFKLPHGKLEIDFGAFGVEVRVDGVRIGQFDRFARFDPSGRLLLRRGFARLQQIAQIVPEGGILVETLIVTQSARSRSRPSARLIGTSTFGLSERLEIRLGGESGAQSGGEMTGGEVLLPDGTPLALSRTASGWEGLLPGRVWLAVAPEADLRLQAKGRDLTFERRALCAWLERAARDPRLEHDDLLALQALEHLRYAQVWPALSGEARAAYAALARRFGLSRFLDQGIALSPLEDHPQSEGAEGPAGVAAVQAGQSALQRAEGRALAALARAWREGEVGDPAALLREVMAEPAALPGFDRQSFFLRLTDSFCLHDAFDALHAEAGGDAPALDPKVKLILLTDRWMLSSMAPWLARSPQVADISDLLWRLTASHEDWLATPAVSEALRHALSRPDLSDTAQDNILWAWRGLCLHEAHSYWGRHACARLRQTTAWLIARSGLYRDEVARSLRAMALDIYGLQPAFWEDLDRAVALEDRLTPDPALRAARAAFESLQQALAGRTAEGVLPPEAQVRIDRALEVFATGHNPDVTRVRRMLLGPAGVVLPQGEGPSMADLLRQSTPPSEAMLRYALFPDAALPAPADPAVRGLVAQGVAEHWASVPVVPHERLQADLGRRLPAILARAERGEIPSAEELRALAADFAALSSPRSVWLGVGLALRLGEALWRGGKVGGADGTCAFEAALAWLAGWLADRVPLGSRRTAALAPAVASGLSRLHYLLGEGALAQVGGTADLARMAALFPKDDLLSIPLLERGSGAGSAPDIGGMLAAGLEDLLVVVFSCQPNLESRIPAMRASWLSDLAARGIPYVVIVGGASAETAGRREGDILWLDCPDDYEGLPQKTLAAVRWVYEQSPYARMMKIDDDCFVDVETLFGGLQPLKHDYLGRPLRRSRGEMDRSWHMAKSQSPRGRLELDKSPEPSLYADGGSGYVLSRRAMKAALETAASPEGQRLIAVSFMEDKMLGDLLTRAGIAVQGEGYRFAQERRTRLGGMTVPLWTNAPRPFRGAGIAGVHLDGHLNQPEALAQSRADQPQRGKIWPSWQKPKFGWSSNTVDLVSPPERLTAAAAAEVAVVACLRNESFMLPHFLDHYRRLGVGGFLIADNGSDDGTLEYLLEQPDVAVFTADTPYNASHYGVAWQEALLSSFRMGRWTVVADADELLVWPGVEPETGGTGALGDLPALLREPDFAQSDAVRLYMLDLYPAGPLKGADFKAAGPFAQAGFCEAEPFLTSSPSRGPFSDQPTWTSGLRHRLIPESRSDLFVAQKLALLRLQPWMRLTQGLHYVGGVRLAPREMVFGHFKYTSEFRAKVEAEVARRQHYNDAEEYRKYLALISEGREVIYDPACSRPWRESAFIRRLWATGRAAE